MQRLVFGCVAWLWLTCSTHAALLDVPTPYIPSTRGNVDEMLRLAAVTPDDVVYDLGSGDGRVVIAAARDYRARGVGIELDPKLVEESNLNARRVGVASRASFRAQDVFAADIREATVVTMYLLSGLVAKLEPKLLADLKPGTRILAHDYGFPTWKPDREWRISKHYMLYIVPARVAGAWRLDAPFMTRGREFVLDFLQQYQEISGGVRVQGGYLPAFEARLAGDALSFVLVEDDVSYRFEGRVRGDVIEGMLRFGLGLKQSEAPFSARRTAAGP